jgi:hypothetical protein
MLYWMSVERHGKMMNYEWVRYGRGLLCLTSKQHSGLRQKIQKKTLNDLQIDCNTILLGYK